MPDLYAAGGIPAVQAELAKKGLLDLDVPTVTGKTLGENIKGAHILNDKAIRPIDAPYSQTGGLQILWGNIAPDGCVVKRSAVAPEMQEHSGPARVFNSEETAIAAIYAARSSRATWWSSATKAPREAPVCVRCSTPPPLWPA